VVVRPFFGGDGPDLVNSFDAWTTYPPCALDGRGVPTAVGLPAPMVLYFARTLDASTRALVAGLTTAPADGAAWRSCFTTITLLGANLTAAQDQYHTRHEEPDWNLGPNMQFYRLLEHMAGSHPAGAAVYYMEADNWPVGVNWLDAVVAETVAKTPFSVVGSTYSGHNWDLYPGDSIIKPALRHHLNGNAVYNTSHAAIRAMRAAFAADAAWAAAAHPSFDVAIAEYLLENQSVAVASLSAPPSDYKASSVLSNFATTLTLPDDIPVGTMLVHGGVFIQHWPTPNCRRSATPGWYPAQLLGPEAVSAMTLVVSDFGAGTMATFAASLDVARTALNASCARSAEAARGRPSSGYVFFLPSSSWTVSGFLPALTRTNTPEPRRNVLSPAPLSKHTAGTQTASASGSQTCVPCG
jgi:hypothetical protein